MTLDVAARRCSMPGCPVEYDAIAVAEGRAQADGWMRWNSLNLRLCPDHAWLWVPVGGGLAPHLPALVRDGGTVWVRCLCGWVLDTSPYTTGESAGRYVGHLAEAVAAASASTDPVRPAPAPVLP